MVKKELRTKYIKSIIVIAVLFSVIAGFIPQSIDLPAYDEVVINIIRRESGRDISMALHEEQKQELYSILKRTKGIYLPSIFAGYKAHERKIYEISIYSKSRGDDFRFFILFDYDACPIVTVRNNTKGYYRKIINDDLLVNFLNTM